MSERMPTTMKAYWNPKTSEAVPAISGPAMIPALVEKLMRPAIFARSSGRPTLVR
jgi:hypothetical protein